MPDVKGIAMQKKVLLVDDEAAFLLPMKNMLNGSGLVVDTAETYEHAKTLISGSVYDAVIADIRLGNTLSKEGLEILGLVRSAGVNTRVIIMTGYGGQDVMQEAYALGADRYFEKPVSYMVLAGALRELGVLE